MSELHAPYRNSIATPARLPPQNVEAEQSVIGGLLLDNSAFDKVGDRLVPEDFYRLEHRLLFDAIARLSEEGKPADVVTVSECLTRIGKLDTAGGLAYIGSLASNTPSAANITAYAGIVHQMALLRRLISLSNEITGAAYKPDGRSASQILDYAEERIMEVTDRTRRTSGPRHMNGILSEAVDRIDALHRSQSPYTGVPTGYTNLDNMTSGLQPGDLIVVAGRPSMGKTSLVMGWAEYAALSQKVPVAVFSMEMSGVQLVNRLLSSLGRIDSGHIRSGKLAEEDWPRLTSAISLLEGAKLFIDDTPALTAMEVRSRARRLKMEHGLGLIVIDYIQLMESSSGNEENRATEVSNITRALKSLAKELNVPVVALSQLNRGVEQRGDKRPVMSDLRESGALEQDADVIMFIYRDEVYNKNPDNPNKGFADIIVAKQRNGPTAEVRLTFLGEYTRFENCTSDGHDGSHRT